MYSEKQTFAAACLGMLLFGIAMISLGAILPEIVVKFQVSELAAGTLVSILPLGILVGSLLFGPLADRYGYKGVLTVSALLVVFGLEGLAFAPSWDWISVATFLVGAGGGALNGATSALVVDTTEGDRSARLSLLGVFFGVGALGMPMLIAMFAERYTLENTIAGIGVLVFFILLFIFSIRYPAAKQKQAAPFKRGLLLLRDPTLLLLSAILFFESGLEGLTNNWITSFLQSQVSLTSSSALVALTVHVAALTAMRLLLGFLLQRFDSYKILWLGMILSLLGIMMLWLSTSYILVLLSLILMGIGFAGVFPIIMGRIGNRWSSLSGTAFSIALVIALFGNMLFNYCMGMLANGYGVEVLPMLLMVALFLMVVVVWRIAESFRA